MVTQLQDSLDEERSSQREVTQREGAAIADLQAHLELERGRVAELQSAMENERIKIGEMGGLMEAEKALQTEMVDRERAACRQLKAALESQQVGNSPVYSMCNYFDLCLRL